MYHKLQSLKLGRQSGWLSILSMHKGQHRLKITLGETQRLKEAIFPLNAFKLTQRLKITLGRIFSFKTYPRLAQSRFKGFSGVERKN